MVKLVERSCMCHTNVQHAFLRWTNFWIYDVENVSSETLFISYEAAKHGIYKVKTLFYMCIHVLSHSQNKSVCCIHCCCYCSLNIVCAYVYIHSCPPNLTINSQTCSNMQFTSAQFWAPTSHLANISLYSTKPWTQILKSVTLLRTARFRPSFN